MATAPVNTANLLGMARTAALAGNNQEAISYYNRVLEVDPTMSEAWLGKGRAVGWQSSISNVRLTETVMAFGHAVGSAPEEERPGVAQEAAGELVKLVDALHGMSRDHLRQFRQLDASVERHFGLSGGLLDNLDSALIWAPDHAGALTSATRICKDLLDEGAKSDYAATLRARMDHATTRLQAIDPTYTPPALAAQTMAEKQQDENDFQMLGAIVAFFVMAVLGVVVAVTR